ncbi:MAG: amino acid adenylation domain-containing protein, partial [Verrucomicrobiota bacterium]
MVHLGTIEESVQPCSIVEAFRRVASQYFDRPAVQSEGSFLTYGELESLSNTLARHLLESGLDRGEPIGVLSARTPDLFVSLLGILKAGGAYLPLDPTYPEERLRFLAEDAGIRFAMGSGVSLAIDGLKWIDPNLPNEEKESGHDLPEISGEDPAYLLYTSGSTGIPKGVLVPHRAVLRLVLNNHFANLGPDTHVLQHSPVAFDASTFEIWGPLLNGGKLSLLPEGPTTLRTIGEAIAAQQVNTLWLTAGLFHALVDERIEDFAGLDQLLAGGDILSPSRTRKVLERFPNLTLINGYGPTENTTFTCCHRITMEEASEGNPIPIGKPIHGTEVYLIDENGARVPQGESGELCAAGSGLALGYWRRPDLTEEKFVPAAWDENTLLYRTGDLAREDERGVYHFEGRRDQQIKVRGYRLELSEIEAALESHNGIEQAVVTAEPSADETDKQLSAWIVASSLPPSEELVRYLEKRLPSYAIPSSYHGIPSIPLTANGKVDRA